MKIVTNAYGLTLITNLSMALHTSSALDLTLVTFLPELDLRQADP
jgi:hypothetical protein